MKRNESIVTAALLTLGAFAACGSTAQAAPRDRDDRQDVKEARREVKEARKDVREESREARKANNPQERRQERRDVEEAREDLRDARGDLRREQLENRNGRYYRNGQVFTGNFGGYNYRNGYRYNGAVVTNNGNVYFSNGRYYRNGRIFTGSYGGYVYNNGYRNNANNGYGYGNYNNQFRTFEGVVVQDNGSTNTFVLRTNNGARLRVTSTSSQMRGLNLGDIVRVSGRTQGANLYTNDVNIIDNR